MHTKLSVITPSYNQADFLERTIKSIIGQGYPNLEYIIIDGGSTDGSVDIIKKYQDKIHYWVSEKDQGQSNAINKGIKIASGEWIGWQNSDDIYYDGAFFEIDAAIRENGASTLITGNINLIDRDDKVLLQQKYVQSTYRGMLAEGMTLTNQAAFWKRSVHEEIGYLKEDLSCGFDYEWFLRLLENHQAVHIPKTLGALRLHDQTKTSTLQEQFSREYKKILQGREASKAEKIRFFTKRILTLAAQGEFSYLAEALVAKIRPPR